MRNGIAVRLNAVGKTYAGAVPVRALEDVTMAVPAGTLSLIEGPSGSGKTTLLSLIGGLDRPTTGHITVFGNAITKLPERELVSYRRSDVGFVFQDFKLIDVLTAVENVALALRLRGMRKRPATDKAQQLLDLLGIAERADSRPGDLSGGEKQRVAIARALVSEPRIVLADEPTANLDGQAGQSVVHLLGSITRHRSTTVIVVSHDTRIAPHADLVFRLLDGRLADPPTEEAA